MQRFLSFVRALCLAGALCPAVAVLSSARADDAGTCNAFGKTSSVDAALAARTRQIRTGKLGDRDLKSLLQSRRNLRAAGRPRSRDWGLLRSDPARKPGPAPSRSSTTRVAQSPISPKHSGCPQPTLRRFLAVPMPTRTRKTTTTLFPITARRSASTRRRLARSTHAVSPTTTRTTMPGP